jgi:hypothetical protein
MNLNDNSEASAGTRPPFGYKLNLLGFYLFNSCLNMNNMNTCTCFVSLTLMFILKYLINCGIKICHKITFYLTIQKL